MLLAMIVIGLAGCKTIERYENKVNLPKNVYTQPIDPNDQAYSGLVRMTPAREKAFGPSERNLVLSNLIDVVRRVGLLEKGVLKNIEDIKANQKDIKKVKDHEDDKN